MRTRFWISATAFALATVPSVLSAQLSRGAAPQSRYGILIGSNLSSVSETFQAVKSVVGAAYNTKRRVGLNAGVYANIPLPGAFSLQPEAHYSQKGVSYEVTNLNAQTTSATVGLKLDYVEVPVLLKIDIGSKASSIHPILFVGASGAFRITCNIDVSSNISSLNSSKACTENTTSTSKDPIEKYDVSAVGGAGLSVSALGRSYALTLRYVQGLSKISTDAGGSSPKNTVFSVQLGIGF